MQYAFATSVVAAVLTLVSYTTVEDVFLKGNLFTVFKLTAIFVWLTLVYGVTNYLMCKLMKAKA